MNKTALFESIYKATFKSISKHVYFNVAQSADAEDIVQTVYAQFYTSVIAKDKTVENPQAYLMTMAKNELTLYYQNKAHQAIQLNEEDQNAWDNIPDELDLALEVIEKSTVEQIVKQMKTLPDLDQKILGGRFRYELTFKEIADQLNQSENTIKTRYYRAIQTLKDKLDQK